MDIELIKKAKEQCESEIKAILVMFEQQSGLHVDIHINREFESIGYPAEITVRIDARLE